jgi:hypothetical protein
VKKVIGSFKKVQYVWKLLILFFIFPAGCAVIKPTIFQGAPVVEPRIFSHESFEWVLQRFVDDDGKVDYSTLQQNSRELDQYYHLVTTYSPDSHPNLFPSENHKLAYWINAYNATVIKTVLTYYPITSVLDVKPPTFFFFLTDKSGFFFFQRLTYGGKTTNLYYLENRVIRKRFKEPLIHFALNCAAQGCPRLPRIAFSGEDLDGQLYQEIRKFLAEERNFRIDHQEKAVFLSSIFKWYEKDYLSWYQERFNVRKATLLDYVGLFLSEKKANELETIRASYPVHFITYDWGLNDQTKSIAGLKR